jgi:hypothetical protein
LLHCNCPFLFFTIHFFWNFLFENEQEFSRDDKLVIGSNNKITFFDPVDADDEAAAATQGIGERIKERALKSYGVQDFLLNIPLLSEEDKSEDDVKYMWNWFECNILNHYHIQYAFQVK